MNFKSIFVYPKYPDNLQRLFELAYNLWSVWDYDAVGLFYRIDAKLFREVNHNPLKLLHCLSRERLEELSENKGFLFELEKVWEKFQHYLQHTGSFKDECPDECGFDQNDTVAYFSMEFGLHECIPIYAGGLGILAGDLLKGASDLNLSVIGIGLLYKFGYFTQYIDPNGYQQEMFTEFENHLVPVRELHDSEGNWAQVTVKILDEDVKAQLWEIDIGKSKLILLDTDIEDNPPHLRDITNELYCSDQEKRIQQELVLGIGGIKALNLLGIQPLLHHFNEGHSAFAVIGRLQNLMQDGKFSFSEAKALIRATTIFTTHTPVIAGNENLNPELVKRYLQPHIKEIELDFDEIARAGFISNNKDVFWMPAFAMRFSKYINGVSKQHARISQTMWSSIFPERSIVEIPIIPITNGVHTSWISPPFTDLFNRYLGPEYIHCGKREDVWKNIYNIPDQELWEEHRRNKKDLVNFIRRQFAEQMIARGYSPARVLSVKRFLNTDYLTIVFARRFAAYKRPTLILKDKERFRKILTNSAHPVQIIFSGKAHPADQQSKEMIREVINFAKEYNVEDRVIFLENYDINIARHLFWGADIWLNYPAPDMEASGTSGMKAAMNGVLHLSTLEGWWLEGYDGKNGWAVTAGTRYKNHELRESADANQLYDLLEHEIAPLYYDHNESDVPDSWVAMMKNSLFSVCQNFSMNRMLCDYLKKSYMPAKKNLARISNDDYSLLKQAVAEEKEVLKCWGRVKLTDFSTNIEKRPHLTEGEKIEVDCVVNFDEARSELFAVELFYLYDKNTAYEILPMEAGQQKGKSIHYKYSFEIKGCGPQSLNVRIKPANDIVQDLHPELIKWKN